MSEKEVSVRFAVSRQPVREAFIKLAENGLIQIRPQRGSYVNKISLSQVRNGCFVRQAIECAGGSPCRRHRLTKSNFISWNRIFTSSVLPLIGSS